MFPLRIYKSEVVHRMSQIIKTFLSVPLLCGRRLKSSFRAVRLVLKTLTPQNFDEQRNPVQQTTSINPLELDVTQALQLIAGA